MTAVTFYPTEYWIVRFHENYLKGYGLLMNSP